MKFEQFLGGSTSDPTTQLDSQICRNWIYETLAASAKGKAALIRTPGLILFTTLPKTPNRNLFPGENRLFGVSGDSFYEVFANGSYTDRSTRVNSASLGVPANGLSGVGTAGSTIGNDGNLAQVFPNGTQVLIVSAGHAYCDAGNGPVLCHFSLDLTGLIIGTTSHLLTGELGGPFDATDVGRQLDIKANAGWIVQTVTITAVDAFGVATVNGTGLGTIGATGGQAVEWLNNFTDQPVTAACGALLGGVGFVCPPQAQKVYYSNVNDFTRWDPTNFFIKAGYPDHVATMLATHTELYTFGDLQATEVWRAATDATNPYQPDPGATMQAGANAPNATVRLGNGVAFIGGDSKRGQRRAYHAVGYIPKPISTPLLEAAWATYPIISDATAYTHFYRGHELWEINFPTANKTWVYDLTTNQWLEHMWWNGTDWDRQRAHTHAVVDLGSGIGDAHFVADWANGKIYYLLASALDDAGTPIHRRRRAPTLTDENQHTFYHRFELDVEGEGSSFILGWSDDRGHTWTTRTALAIAIGAHAFRVTWRRLGDGRARIYQLDCNDAVDGEAIVNAYLRMTQGTS